MIAPNQNVLISITMPRNQNTFEYKIQYARWNTTGNQQAEQKVRGEYTLTQINIELHGTSRKKGDIAFHNRWLILKYLNTNT